jgi:hypothetical protein
MNNSFKGLQDYLNIVNGVEQQPTPLTQEAVPVDHTVADSITFEQSQDASLSRIVDLINYSNK